MSNSARERDNPPPRRKSCTACIKAKRRCEYAGAPACLRCAQRNVPCDYPPAHQQRASTTTQRVASMLSALAEDRSLLDAASAIPSYDGAQDDLDALLATPLGMDEPSIVDMDKSNSFHFGSLDGFEMLGGDLNNNAMGGLCGLEPLSGSSTYNNINTLYDENTPSVAEDNYVPEIDFLKEARQQHMGTLMAPAAKQLEYVSTMIRERLEFAVDLIRTAPRTMVEALEAPWSHRLLYKTDMPCSMQDALGACALYLAKNPVNTPVVFGLIDARVTALLSNPPPPTLRLALAHTHALILYQVMRLFDGDISARARGERLIPALEAATMHLLSFVRFDSELLRVTDLAAFPVQPARELWHDWRLHESARRTVLITFYMLQAYRAMAAPAGQHAGARCAALRHSWTLSRGLWHAESAVEFASCWREGRWFVVTNGRWEDTLRRARADDVDSFGKMWITALMGVEETEGWFAAKGGSLREKDAAAAPAPATMVC
ncbi:Zn(2)-C6 fungal-type DNA-binding domain protein [Akanthomyces lecanii RCEF 1005]|uniref:Zn(2)-C6 fungal-type DNA-binding domain protein n=1 Tax=Akanthomyces lecanii RCEF 1005 TaxID=1081108 RepID=A0A168H4I2_CORDF|nr:Zn(2)-C6 fungal-type DNA-binding domain protein [Akanthomyces lecanii RCEF 1005]